MQDMIDLNTNRFKTAVDIRIGEPKQGQTVDLLQIRPPPPVIGQCGFLIVLCAVQFYGQLGFFAIEINDIRPKGHLAAKADGIGGEKIIPKVVFLSGGVFP